LSGYFCDSFEAYQGLWRYLNLIDLNDPNLYYLYHIDKGTPLPSYQRRTNVAPSSYKLRGSFFRW